jgi:hypothetical protein
MLLPRSAWATEAIIMIVAYIQARTVETYHWRTTPLWVTESKLVWLQSIPAFLQNGCDTIVIRRDNRKKVKNPMELKSRFAVPESIAEQVSATIVFSSAGAKVKLESDGVEIKVESGHAEFAVEPENIAERQTPCASPLGRPICRPA